MEKIKEMAKVLLHIHLDGSLRTKTVQKWLKEEQINVPLNELKKQLQVSKNCKSLEEYLEKFKIPCDLLQTKERLKIATYELIEDCAKENIIYVEIRFAPNKHTKNKLSLEEVIEAVLEGKNQAEQKYPIKSNIILCMMRGDSKEQNLNILTVAKAYLNKGICGIDLAGAETLYKTSDYEELFMAAKTKKIPFTVHAGESLGIESIIPALKCQAIRIGHGVRSIEDINIVKHIRKNKITLEICPTSNKQTNAINGKHPLEFLYKHKIRTTLNTDNNTVSNINLTKEYENILKNTNLTIKDFQKMNLYAIDAAFVDQKTKKELKKQLKKNYKQ